MRSALRHPVAAYVIVGAAALGVRAAVLATLSAGTFYDNPVIDAQYHHHWAQALAADRPDDGQRRFLDQPYFKPPLYPHLLGAWQAAFGESVRGPKAAQALLGSLGCLIVLAIARRAFGPAAGLAAGLAAAVYWPWIFFDAWLLSTELVIFLNLLAAWLLAGAPGGGGRWRVAAAGAALGLSAVTWPTALLLVPVAAWWVYRWAGADGDRRRRAATAAVLVAAAAAPVIVVASRNVITAGDAVLISSNGGINFYIGNRPEADGHSPVPTGLAWERLLREERDAGIERPSAASAYWLRRGLAAVADRPARAAALLARKAVLLFSAAEPRNNLAQDYFRRRHRWLGLLPGFGVIGPLALIGLWLALRRPGATRDRPALWLCIAFPATALAAMLPFFVCDRFRVVAVPLLLPFAGLAAVALVRAFLGRRAAPLAVHLAALVVLGAAINVDWCGAAPRSFAPEHFHLGRIHLRLGDAELAELEFGVSLADADDADAWVLLSHVRAHRHDWRGSADAARRCVALAPDAADGHGNLGAALLQLGSPGEALEHLDRAVALEPARATPRLDRAAALVMLGRRAAARRDLQAARKLPMSAPQGRLFQALVLQASGPDTRPDDRSP